MAFHAMVDMAKTPAEAKEDIAESMPPTVSGGNPQTPVYPYGLCISFDEETLEKLGMGDDELPEVGDMIHLIGMAKVTSVNQNEMEDAGGNKTVKKRIELQFTHLAAEDEDDEEPGEVDREARQQRLYGTVDNDAG